MPSVLISYSHKDESWKDRYNSDMESDEDRERAARAKARRSWPIRKFRLGEEPDDDLSATTTAKERLEMMWPMTVDAWILAGKKIPDYPRDKAPVRVIRREKENLR